MCYRGGGGLLYIFYTGCSGKYLLLSYHWSRNQKGVSNEYLGEHCMLGIGSTKALCKAMLEYDRGKERRLS